MFAPLLIFTTAILLLQGTQISAGAGYHYDPPGTSDLITRHHFTPIATASPLPAVPALPALPTARPNTEIQSQTLVQVHPPQRSIASAYLPPSAQNNFHSARASQGVYQQSILQPPSAVGYQQSVQPVFGQRIAAAQPPPSAAGPIFPVGLASPPLAQPQPLRIPYGKQALINYPASAPDRDFYFVNGRQLKQYAVIEFIDNDIEQNTQPFLSTQFFHSSRADLGASGTGATGGLQINSRANALVLEQQRFAQQRSSGGGNADAIALGSGGLGFIRQPNGNVFLGSGSLAYVSGQQRSQSLLEARTRTGALTPGPLNFGHGALGGRSLIFGYK